MLRSCPGPGRVPGGDDLVAGHEHRGARRAGHPERVASGRGGEDEVRRREAAARGEEQRALRRPLRGGGRARPASARRRAARSSRRSRPRPRRGRRRRCPGGIGAPVMTFHAAPAGSGPGTRPAPGGARAAEKSRASGSTSAARTAQPSIAVVSKAGKRQVGARRPRRGRATAASPSGTSHGRERRHGLEHVREGLVERDHGGDASKARHGRRE